MALVVGTDSYASVEEADAFFSGMFFADVSPWGSASAADKERALVTATRRIDALRFVGAKADPLQALKFPRSYAVREGDEPGVYVESAILPHVKRACMEEALATLAGEKEPAAVARQREGITSAKIGSTSETYSGAGALRPALLSEAAAGYLKPYIRSGAAFG